MVCQKCGLIRAQYYFRDEDVTDFYKNFYIDKDFRSGKEIEAKTKFDDQFRGGKVKFDLINRFKIEELKN